MSWKSEPCGQGQTPRPSVKALSQPSIVAGIHGTGVSPAGSTAASHNAGAGSRARLRGSPASGQDAYSAVPDVCGLAGPVLESSIRSVNAPIEERGQTLYCCSRPSIATETSPADIQ